MRRFDKNKNITRANILAEQRYLESKGLINENDNQRPLRNQESSSYDNSPMRHLNGEEFKNIENSISKLNGFQGKGIDPTQDFAIKLKTPVGVVWTSANSDNLHMLKIPETAYVIGTIGNMNYTDAYKNNSKESGFQVDEGIPPRPPKPNPNYTPDIPGQDMPPPLPPPLPKR